MNKLLKNWLLPNKVIQQANSKLLLLACCIFIAQTSSAQLNKVENGDFEKYSACPQNDNSLLLASGWDTIRAGGGGYGEYLNSCCSNTIVGIPSNFAGYKETHSAMDMLHC
jgi:hypothetical protein